jgi:hypothetical protein
MVVLFVTLIVVSVVSIWITLWTIRCVCQPIQYSCTGISTKGFRQVLGGHLNNKKNATSVLDSWGMQHIELVGTSNDPNLLKCHYIIYHD